MNDDSNRGLARLASVFRPNSITDAMAVDLHEMGYRLKGTDVDGEPLVARQGQLVPERVTEVLRRETAVAVARTMGRLEAEEAEEARTTPSRGARE